jgi:RsiW-degrading membrane proteinase PrsW (M82 family)
MTLPPDFAKLLLIAVIGLVVSLYAYAHARAYREGLPPILDAFFSGAAFAILCAAFIYGGRIGALYEMTTEGRIAGLGMAIMLLRWLRARLGIELAEWRAPR